MIRSDVRGYDVIGNDMMRNDTMQNERFEELPRRKKPLLRLLAMLAVKKSIWRSQLCAQSKTNFGTFP